MIMLYIMDTNMNIVESTEVVQEVQKPPSKQLLEIQKLRGFVETQTDQMDVLRTSLKTLMNSNVSLMKQIKRLEAKMEKQSQRSKANRKPHGFARPTEVSDDLCIFMGKEKGTLVSRTEVTKSIIKYIADNNLQNPENKRQILPDETLLKLFGDEARNNTIDYFTMQKYVNHHFPKKVTP